MDPESLVLLFAAGLIGGALSAVAGGSSFFTFPALMLSGLTPLVANATNFVGLVPSNITALQAYRIELRKVWPTLTRHFASASLGAGTGSVLLLWIGGDAFRTLVPWLMLVATTLFAAGPWAARRLAAFSPHKNHQSGWLAMVMLFLCSVYGGFFGAGLGVIILASLSVIGYDDIHEANTIKNILISISSIVSVSIYIISGNVSWPHALVLVVGTAIGGYFGGNFARRTPRHVLRFAIIVFGAFLTAFYFWSD